MSQEAELVVSAEAARQAADLLGVSVDDLGTALRELAAVKLEGLPNRARLSAASAEDIPEHYEDAMTLVAAARGCDEAWAKQREEWAAGL